METHPDNIFIFKGGPVPGHPQIMNPLQNCPDGRVQPCTVVYYPHADIVILLQGKSTITVEVSELQDLVNAIKERK